MENKNISTKDLENFAYECAIKGIDLEEAIKSITSWEVLQRLAELKNKNLDYLKKVFELKEDK